MNVWTAAATKNGGRCKEVAVVERYPLAEVRLYEVFQVGGTSIQYNNCCTLANSFSFF